MRKLAAVLCVFLVVPALVYASPRDCSPASTNLLSVYDLVAYGSGQDKVYLATPYGNTALFRNAAKWRLRTILLPLSARPCNPDSISLAPTGTKMLVSCPEKPPIIIDLTAEPVSSDLSEHQHSLASPGQAPVLFFHRTSAGITVYREEKSDVSVSPKLRLLFNLEGAIKATELASGKVVYITGNTQLVIRDMEGFDKPAGTISPRLSDDAVLLATGAKDKDDFVLTTGAESPKAYLFTSDDSKFSPVDTSGKDQTGGLIEVLKTLYPHSDFDKAPKSCGDKRAYSYVCVDSRHPDAAKVKWHGITFVQPFHDLYAPVFEFAREETVYPSATDIWPSAIDSNLGCPGGAGQEQTDCLYRRWYLPEHPRPWEDSKVLYKTNSCRGTWLFEYWTYYPFDVGGVKSHMHDPEHIFVEVDKLGGRPLTVLGAAHSFLSPNNMYNTIRRTGASPIPLPIVAMVELGKHATAPDINQDGRFNPGIDTNVNAEQSQVWGIRDAIGISDSHVTKYDASMTVPRTKEDRLLPPRFKYIFPKAVNQGFLGANRDGREYELQGFPASPSGPCTKPETKECADSSLTSHPDSKEPRAIFKNYVFPAAGIRAGYTQSSAGRGLSVSGVVSLFEPLGLLLGIPLPGRVALDLQYLTGLSSGQLVDTGRVNRAVTVGATYERHLTNLFGFYGGPLWRFDWTDRGSQYGGTWYRGGPMVEIPTPHGGFTVQVGPLLSSRLNKTVSLEFRLSWYPYKVWKVSSRQNRYRFGRWSPRFWRHIKEY